jgi:peptidoglycan/LPS O-acetylase OafA/YrhL
MAVARDGHIDTLRGLACILLVAFHVIGDGPAHGMHISTHDNWRLFTELFIHLRMPLFSFLSGYVFTAFVADRAALGAAIAKKLRRLGIPLVVVSTLFYLCFGLVYGHFSVPLWQIYVLPYEHFWYLQATILMMVGLLVGCYLAGTNARLLLTGLFPIACLVFVAAPLLEPNVFAINSVFYLLPFFLLGQLLRVWSADRRIRAIPARRIPLAILFGLVVTVLFGLDVAQLAGLNQLDFERQSALGLLFSVSTCLALYFSQLEWQPLAFVGGYSYTIYLFHVFFTAGLRKILDVVSPGLPAGLYFAAALLAGMLLPILLHQVLIRRRWSALLFLGISRDRRDARRGAGDPAEQRMASS